MRDALVVSVFWGSWIKKEIGKQEKMGGKHVLKRSRSVILSSGFPFRRVSQRQ